MAEFPLAPTQATAPGCTCVKCHWSLLERGGRHGINSTAKPTRTVPATDPRSPQVIAPDRPFEDDDLAAHPQAASFPSRSTRTSGTVGWLEAEDPNDWD